MDKLRVHELLPQRVISTREAARTLRPAIKQAITPKGIVIDFEEVEGVAPSFVDELLGTILEFVKDLQGFEIVVLHPPTRLSSKFQAIGRGRGLSIEESASEGWRIRALAA